MYHDLYLFRSMQPPVLIVMCGVIFVGSVFS